MFLNRFLQRATMEALVGPTEALLQMVQLVSLVIVVIIIRVSAATDRVTVMQNVFRASNGIP